MDAIREARDEKEETGPPTEISLDPRPLMDVPGFEGLLQVRSHVSSCVYWRVTTVMYAQNKVLQWHLLIS